MAKKSPASKKATKKAGAKKASAKKASAQKAAGKKAAAKTTKKAAPKKSAAKKATAKKATAKKATAEKAPAKKTSAKRGGATLDRFLESQRKALLDERETYTRQATALQAEADQLAADREPGDSQFDEEGGEGDTTSIERERDLALSAQALAAVEEIDDALARIDAGTYGVCVQCGATIPKERLKAIPWAALCIPCKSGGLGRRR